MLSKMKYVINVDESDRSSLEYGREILIINDRKLPTSRSEDWEACTASYSDIDG